MSKYSDFIQSVAANRGGNYSRREFVALNTVMMNDPDYEASVYSKKGEGYEAKTIAPGKAIRESVIAPVLKQFGVDKSELAKLDSVQISTAGGEALADFALLAVKNYISTEGMGRKLTLPMTSPNETIQSIGVACEAENTRETTMIVKGEDGAYHTTPTGKSVTTSAHDKIVGKNRVPSWLKTTQDVKK